MTPMRTVDPSSSENFSDILDEAIVLGHDHFKKTVKINENSTPALEEFGRLSIWTDEPIRNYDFFED